MPPLRQGGDLGGGRGDPPQGGGHGRQPRADAVAVRLGPGPRMALVAQKWLIAEPATTLVA